MNNKLDVLDWFIKTNLLLLEKNKHEIDCVTLSENTAIALSENDKINWYCLSNNQFTFNYILKS